MRSGTSAVILAAALVMQAGILFLPAALAPPVAAGAVLLTLTAGSYRARSLLRVLRPLLIMLLAVLFTRLLLDPSLEAFRGWLAYTSRLLAAVCVALIMLRRMGPSGVIRGLSLLLTPLPRALRRPVRDLLAAAIFFIPAARQVLGGSAEAAKIRLSREYTGAPGRTVAVSRASLITLAALPPRRAEAMVVRRLV